MEHSTPSSGSFWVRAQCNCTCCTLVNLVLADLTQRCFHLSPSPLANYTGLLAFPYTKRLSFSSLSLNVTLSRRPFITNEFTFDTPEYCISLILVFQSVYHHLKFSRNIYYAYYSSLDSPSRR